MCGSRIKKGKSYNFVRLFWSSDLYDKVKLGTNTKEGGLALRPGHINKKLLCRLSPIAIVVLGVVLLQAFSSQLTVFRELHQKAVCWISGY